MNIESLKTQLFKLLSRPSYMPMRKRGLAKMLEIPDEDYAQFRRLLDELAESGEIAELKRGKFGLPLDSSGRRAPQEKRHGGEENEAEPEAENAADEAEQGVEGPPKFKKKETDLPKGARIGRIDVKRGGMGFLLSEPPGNDIFIPPDDLGGAIDGDLVAVEMKRRDIVRGRRGRPGWGGAGSARPAGRVIKILERAHPQIVGTYYSYEQPGIRSSRPSAPRQSAGYIVPDTPGMFAELEVLSADKGIAANRDKVAVELIEAEESHRSGARPTARIVKVFGRAGDAVADIGAIIANFNIKTEFPEEVLRHAEEIPEEISEEELARRVDYTQPVTFTIDPSDAKDHDDAVAIRREEDGNYTLLVHIADVSHYVREDSPIDVEARDRATSVYLPGTVYPMLPQKLSNNVCSLKEGKVRLTKTVSMTFGKNLQPIATKIERSYIRSAAFLTYDLVKEAIDEDKPELVRTPEIFQTLEIMKDFAGELRRKRLATGSLDLELPESRLLLDEKLEVKGWTQVEHHWAHELIEDMMLAANRAVAEYMVDHEIPGLFRIHEEPDEDALRRFIEFVREFGISLKPPLDRLKIKSVLDRVRGKEYAHTIHLALLTSLKQARYSAECHPHFALNFNRYLHFTSPIRRYPDLVVHRALDSRFEPGEKALRPRGKKRPGGERGDDYFKRVALLHPLAAHCSLREREADKAEEEVVKFRQMEFLRRNMRESHPGLITRVRDFGLFIELQDCYVEGLVKVSDLTDDYYVYYENQHLLQGRRKHRSFRLGDKVEVRIAHIDLGKKQVDLEIV